MNDRTIEHAEDGEALVKESPQRELTVVSAYSPIAHAVVELQRYKGVAFDLTTTKGNDEARGIRKRLVSLRTGLERIRLDMNREDRAEIDRRLAQRNDEAKRLTTLIEEVERPIDDQIVADEQRREAEKIAKAEAEAKRVKDIRARIDAIAAVPLRAVGKPSQDIDDKLALVLATKVDDTFAEFAAEAAAVKDDAAVRLRDLHALTKRAEDQAAELERQRAELAQQREAERLRQLAQQAQETIERNERERQEAAARRAQQEQQQREEAERRAERLVMEERERAQRNADIAHLAAQRAELAEREEAIRVQMAAIREREAAAERQRIDEANAKQKAITDKMAAERAALAEREKAEQRQADVIARLAPRMLAVLRAILAESADQPVSVELLAEAVGIIDEIDGASAT